MLLLLLPLPLPLPLPLQFVAKLRMQSTEWGGRDHQAG